jgi:type VI protein secretion system component VasA
LRLSPSDLKKQMLALQGPASQAPVPTLSFVELPPAPKQSEVGTGVEIELQRPDGSRMYLRCGDTTLPVLLRAFLEVH